MSSWLSDNKKNISHSSTYATPSHQTPPAAAAAVAAAYCRPEQAASRPWWFKRTLAMSVHNKAYEQNVQ